jgi:hypothetical protein
MATTPYCADTDLIVGTDIPLPATAITNKFLTQGAEEIDIAIGNRYITPIVGLSESDPNTRAAALLLKRLNTYLSSGRLIMASASAKEDEKLHQYGMYLVKEAQDVLKRISGGDLILNGATTIDALDGGRSGPLISNLDPVSNVESFYGMVTNQAHWGGYYPPPIFPAGVVTYPPYTS